MYGAEKADAASQVVVVPDPSAGADVGGGAWAGASAAGLKQAAPSART